MTIYVAPDKDWYKDVNGFEMHQINLTWQAKNYSGSILEIDVYFNNISFISPNRTQDKLMVWMNENKTIFQQLEAPHEYINKNSTVLEIRIVKQIEYSST
jgi:hypothetical protein